MSFSKAATDEFVARQAEAGALDLSALGRALWRRKWRVILPTLLFGSAAIVFVNVVPASYKAVARVELRQPQETASSSPTFDKTVRDAPTIDDQAVASQIQLIESPDLGRKVVADPALKLIGNAEFDPAASTLGMVRAFLNVVGLARTLPEKPEDRVLVKFLENLQAYQLEKSRVIGIEFSARDPVLAADAANAVAVRYRDALIADRQGETGDASDALSPKVDELKADVEKAEQTLAKYRADKGLYISGNNTTLSSQQLTDINTQVSNARAKQVEAQARANLLKELLKSGRPIEVTDINNNELMRRLLEQQATLRSQLALDSRTLLPGHPRIKELSAQLAGLQAQITAEARKAVRSLENDAQIAGASATSLAGQLDVQKGQAAQSNQQEIELRALEREAKAKRDLLESYMQRFTDAQARSTLSKTPVIAQIIAQASAPQEPYFPKKLPIIFIATMIGFVLSLSLAAARELLSGAAFVPSSPSVIPVVPASPAASPFQAGAQLSASIAWPMSYRLEPIQAAAAERTPKPMPVAPADPPPVLKSEEAPLPVPSAPVEVAALRPAMEAAVQPKPTEPLLVVKSEEAPAPLRPVPVEVAASPPAADVPLQLKPAEPFQVHRSEEALLPVPPATVPAAAPRSAAEAALAGLIAEVRERLPTTRSLLVGGTVGANRISAAAALLARGLADGGARVVMVELESAAHRLGMASEGVGLGDLLHGEASFVDVIHRDDGSRLHLIAAGRPMDEAPIQASERLAVIFEALSTTYDTVIFDMGPLEADLPDRLWASLIAACNLSVIVFDPAQAEALDSARDLLQSLGAREVGQVAFGAAMAAAGDQAAA